MKRVLLSSIQIPLTAQTLLTSLSGLVAGLAVTTYLLIGGDLLRFVLAFMSALLTAALLERNNVSTVTRWAYGLPVGLLVYVLMLSLH